jgi:hypothetical protein
MVAFLALASPVPQIRKALRDTHVRSRQKLTLPPQSGRRFCPVADKSQLEIPHRSEPLT